MKTNQYQPLKTALLAGLLAGAFLASSSADIIYQDTFIRPAGALGGSAPTTDNSGLAATWTAGPGYSLTGTNCLVDNTVGGWQAPATLPLNWLTTFTNPTAQVDVQITAGNFVALQFGDGAYYGWPGMPAVLILRNNGTVDVCQGAGWDGGFVKASFPGAGNAGGWNTLRIVYSNTLQTASFYVNGALLTNVVVPDIPPLRGDGSWATGVGLVGDTTATLCTNFIVTFGNDGPVIPPSITTQPVGKAVFTNDPVRLSVDASGSLPLHFQWRKNGADIPDATSRIYTIPAAAMSDTGEYDVVITNAATTANVVTSTAARVEVHFETKTILTQVNWDDFNTVAWNTAYTFSSDGTLSLPAGFTNEIGVGVGGSHGLKAYADGSAFQEASISWAGFAGGVALRVPRLPVADPYYYECSFNARVENLKEGVTNTAGRLDIRFIAPDGTLGATNGGYDTVISVERPCTLSSNFQAVTFVLKSANYGGEPALPQFATYLAQIDTLQFEFTCDGFYGDFVNGPDDIIVIDDVKMVLRGSPPLSMTWSGTQAVLSWIDPNVQLQGAADVAGPYTTISGATSSYTVPVDSPYHYFRTQFLINPESLINP